MTRLTTLAQYIDNESYAIGIITNYLNVSKQDVTKDLFQKKFAEITKSILQEKFNSSEYEMPITAISNPNVWTEIELTTCGKKGRTGPTREECIAYYKGDWCKNIRSFNVFANRPGIQQIKIPRTGLYKISAWGAGNLMMSGSGNVFNNI